MFANGLINSEEVSIRRLSDTRIPGM